MYTFDPFDTMNTWTRFMSFDRVDSAIHLQSKGKVSGICPQITRDLESIEGAAILV